MTVAGGHGNRQERARRLLIRLVGLAFSPASAFWSVIPASGVDGPEAYRWRAPLMVEAVSGALISASVPWGVLDVSRSFPADLRVFDQRGVPWRFFMTEEAERDRRVEAPGRQLPGPAFTSAVLPEAPAWDFGIRHAPIREVWLFPAADASSAGWAIHGANAETGRWERLGIIVASGIEAGKPISSALDRAFHRFLRVEPHGGEIAPAITAVTARLAPQRLYCLAELEGPAWLYVGSDEAYPPLFAWRHELSPAQLRGAIAGAVGPIESNPLHFQARLAAYGRLLLAVTLSIFGVLAFGVLLKRIRG